MSSRNDDIKIESSKVLAVENTKLYLDDASDNNSGTPEDRDEADLARMGKLQVLRRSFGFWTALGLSMSVTVTWEAALILFESSLFNGGPTGVIAEYAVTWVGFTCVVASIAELASLMPLAGGQYHWVYAFSPPEWRVLLSYITGWQTTIAWQASLASGIYLTATVLQGLIVQNYPDYDLQRWQGTLLAYAILLPCAIVNTLLAKYLSKVEGMILGIHLALFPCILIPLVVLAPHGTASELFAGGIMNGGGYSSAGLTFLVGSIGNVFAFLGADAVCHMAEEISDPSRNVPRVMVATLFLNGLLGFASVIALVFCIGNLHNALHTPTGYPFIEIFVQAVNSVQGGTAMAAFIVAVFIFAVISYIATTSRMTWAFARDKGLPGSRWLGKVEPRTQLPLWSLALSVVISVALIPITIGSPQAFSALISISVSGFLGSYILPIVLLMYKRIKDPGSIPAAKFSLGWARWPINIVGLAWILVSTFFSFWPTSVPVTNPAAMNWSCLLYGVAIIFATVFYAVHARHEYRGPIIETSEVEHKA